MRGKLPLPILSFVVAVLAALVPRSHAAPVVYRVSKSVLDSSIDRLQTFASLQGLCARDDMWVFYGNNPGTFWSARLALEGVQKVDVYSWSDLLDICSNHLQRYILYDPAFADGVPANAEIAYAMAGLSNAVVATSTLEPDIQARGGSKILDVRGWNWADVTMASLGADYFCSIPTGRTVNGSYVADFCVASTSIWRYVPYDGLPGDPNFFQHFNTGAVSLGWFLPSVSEGDAIIAYSQRGMYSIPTDWNMSFAALAYSAPAVTGDFHQPIQSPRTIDSENVHLVALVITDGDNLLLWNDAFQNADFWSSGYRGQFALNWFYPPRLATLSRVQHKYYCREATSNDLLVSGPSGSGYYYPDRLPDSSALNLFAGTDNQYMKDADIDIWCPMLGTTDFPTARDVIDQMLAKMPDVEAVVPLSYAGYHSFNGADATVRGIPVIAGKYSMWQGYHTPEELAAIVNGAPTGLSDPAAYSVIHCHRWSYTVNDIATRFIPNIDADVRVVDLKTFTRAYATRIGNMVRNGTVESGADWPDDWYHSGTQTEWSEEKSVSATHSLKLADVSPTVGADWRSELFALPTRVRALDFSWCWSYTGLQGTWFACIRWYTNDTTASWIGQQVFSPVGSEQASFVQEHHSVVPPADARYADVVFWAWEDAVQQTLGTMWVDDVRVRIEYDEADPAIHVSPTSLYFATEINIALDKVVTVSNAGGCLLTGTALGTQPPFAVLDGVPYSLTNGMSAQITFRFLSGTPGYFTNYIEFTGGGGANACVIGHAVPEPVSRSGAALTIIPLAAWITRRICGYSNAGATLEEMQ